MTALIPEVSLQQHQAPRECRYSLYSIDLTPLSLLIKTSLLVVPSLSTVMDRLRFDQHNSCFSVPLKVTRIHGRSLTAALCPSPPVRQNSGSHTPRVRPHATTLNIPGLTKSKVSPDGRIPDRDVASKLLIVMVGLPARGKSYITKKIQRYLNWQQHNTRIFNVGSRRRVAAGFSPRAERPVSPKSASGERLRAASILLNGIEQNGDTVEETNGHTSESSQDREPPSFDLNTWKGRPKSIAGVDGPEAYMDQSANFFDPRNTTARALREQVAMDTLDEALDYLLFQNGSVGILDATNSTIHRRELIVKRVKEREPKLGILFIESICHDQTVSL